MVKPALHFRAIIHELDAHVGSLSLFCSEIDQFGESDRPRLKERLQCIRRAATSVQRITRALRLMDSDEPLARTRCDVSALAAAVATALQQREAKFERAEVRIQSAMHIDASVEALELVLSNLIGNALKFSSKSSKPCVRVTCSQEGHRTVIHVSDNGVGISAEDCERVFGMFERANPSFGGSGVGLAIVKRLVDRHEGRVWAHGEPGNGMTVSFYLD